ncbi:MAG: poly(hydroxyalkanoate) granule-associated protein [Alcanivorax sp.]|jgi:poly(hydroxyalkanoate) granule-associated protein|uniref:phasin family protein n=1 Tax=unclassified Alcanivorax TaxID=2638842 RepID=UPI00260DDFEC|nr:phasin family protein [uncultured Alcanivorax sp.]
MSDDKQNEKEERNPSPLKALSGASRDIRKYTHQIWLAGLGAFARAEEEGSGFFDALVEAGREVERHTKDKTESRVEEIKERVRHHTGETMDKMEKAFDDRLNKALSRLGLPNKREVEELEKRVHELTSALSKAEEDVSASSESDTPKRRSRKKS